MDDVALLPDAVLSVLHEVLQRHQRVLHHRHHVFRGPGFHGNQHDPGVELLLEDLRSTKTPITFADVSVGRWTFPVLTVSAVFTTALAKFLVWLLERRSCTNCRETPTDGSFANTHVVTDTRNESNVFY